MATQNPYQNEQVPYHKRIAAGEKLDGTSMQPKGGTPNNNQPKGGLSQTKKK